MNAELVLKYMVYPLVLGIISVVIYAYHLQVKTLKADLAGEKKERIAHIDGLLKAFSEGMKADKDFWLKALEEHRKRFEELKNKMMKMCLENERIKKDLEGCVKTCDRIKFKN